VRVDPVTDLERTVLAKRISFVFDRAVIFGQPLTQPQRKNLVSNQRVDVLVIHAAPLLLGCIECDVVPVKAGVDAAGRVAEFEELA